MKPDEYAEVKSHLSISVPIGEEDRQISEALEESRQILMPIFENTEDGILVVRIDNQYLVTGNQTICRMLGYSIEELGTLTASDIHPPEEMNRILRHFGTVAKGKSTLTKEIPVRRKDNSIFCVDIASVPIILAGKTYSLNTFRDASEYKKAEKLLREPLKEYETIFECCTDAIVVLSRDRKIISCSKAFCDLFRYGRSEIIGESIRMIHPSEESFISLGARIYPTIDKEGSYRTDWRFARSDGTAFSGETVTSAIRDDQQTITGYIAIIRDVTERRTAEKALKESEERYRIAIEHSNDGVAIIENLIHTYVNRKLVEIFGYENHRQIIGKPVAFLVHPDDKDRVVSYLKARQNDDAAPSRYEFKGIRKDGTTIYIEASAATVTYQDNRHALAFLRDITKRKVAEEALKESEEKYRLLIQNATDSIFIVQDGVIKFPNPKTEERYGYSAKELATIPFIEHVHTEDRATVMDHYGKKIRGKESSSTYPVRVIGKDHRELWGEISSVLVEWEGKPAVLTFVRDITEQKKLESQLFQAQKMEAVGTLAGGIAHDFNNLLMGIQGYTSLMLFNLTPEHPFYGKLKHIEDQVKSGADLTKQILGFARGGRYEIKPTDLNDIVRKTSTMFSRTKKEIIIRCTYEKDLWTTEVDRGQMEQVLLNLYVNAWQAMPHGGTLHIKTRNVNIGEDHSSLLPALKAGSYVKISVTDTGVGMDEKTRERIFEPFFTTKEMGRGTGLGLASAYGIVKGHKGTINVMSESGKGTTFHIYLPAAQAEALRDAQPVEKIRKGAETILIVDDEEPILKVSSEILKALGYKVIPAKSGNEAVEIYAKGKEAIDLVILDMIMPEMSGGTTFAFLKMLNPQVKAILSSGYSMNEQAEDIMQQGCQAFIQKPFTIHNLSQKVREVLDSE